MNKDLIIGLVTSIALHLLVSMANIAITVVLLWRLWDRPHVPRVVRPAGHQGHSGDRLGPIRVQVMDPAAL